MSSPIASSYDGSCAAVGKIPQGAKNPPQLGRCCLNGSSFRSRAIDESSASCGPAICLSLWYLQSPATARAAAEAAEENCCLWATGVAEVGRGIGMTRRVFGGVLGPKEKVVGCGSQSRGGVSRPKCRGEKPASQAGSISVIWAAGAADVVGAEASREGS